MHPVLFSLGSVPVSSYGFFVTLGYLAALWLGRYQARARGLRAATFTDACLVALFAGLVGARLMFVATNWEYFSGRFGEIFSPWSGGLVFFGGLLLATPALAVHFARRGPGIAEGFDLLAPALALGHAIGRIGCFLAGCCHGSYCPYPWGVTPHSPLVEAGLRGQPLHPTQLYESIGLFVIAAGLLRLGRWPRARRRPGTVAATYLCAYGALRFVVEIFRGDSIRGFVPGSALSISQALCLGLLALGGGWLLVGNVRRNH
jgi:phosphatidylglycerol:prolipoprotein diacylglycerol transferase